MPFCEKCGVSVKPYSNFCRNCGAPQETQTQLNYSPTPAQTNYNNSMAKPSEPTSFLQPSQPSTIKQIISFIIVNKSKRFGGEEYFTCILTSAQMIFAPMTKDMLKEVTNISRQNAKNNIATSPEIYPYQQMYFNAPPTTILSQTIGSFSIQNSSIREIKLKLVNNASDGYSDSQEYELRIVTDPQTFTFHMTKREEYFTRLKEIYQERIKLL
jgi:hypothetical protein